MKNCEQQTLLNSDKDYMHLVNNEFVSSKYIIPQTANNATASYFLVSSGYYHSLEKITGKANYNESMKFKEQGAFDKFSKQKYKEAQGMRQPL